MKYISLYLATGTIICSSIIGCANASNTKTTSTTQIIYIDDESNAFSNKQQVFFQENNKLTKTPDSSEIANIIIGHATKIPELEIKITYKQESGLANQVAEKVHAKVNNQIYIEKCCKLDSGRSNLKNDQITINYYKISR